MEERKKKKDYTATVVPVSVLLSGSLLYDKTPPLRRLDSEWRKFRDLPSTSLTPGLYHLPEKGGGGFVFTRENAVKCSQGTQ